MAGLTVTEYLARHDLDRFLAIVRRYSHDVLSPAANIAISAEVCGKLLRRRAANVLTDPSLAEEAAQPFDVLLQQALEFPKAARRFVWGENPDDEDITRAMAEKRWRPFDATAWDHFVAEYIAFVSAQLQGIEVTVQQIERWLSSAPLTPEDQSGDFRGAVLSLRHTLNEVWGRLEPHVAEQRIMAVIADNGAH